MSSTPSVEKATDLPSPSPPSATREEMVKQLARVVCICKGIPLKKFLPALKVASTVEEVHQRVGSGDGGCQGRRCSPRIEVLLEKTRHLSSPERQSGVSDQEDSPR